MLLLGSQFKLKNLQKPEEGMGWRNNEQHLDKFNRYLSLESI